MLPSLSDNQMMILGRARRLAERRLGAHSGPEYARDMALLLQLRLITAHGDAMVLTDLGADYLRSSRKGQPAKPGDAPMGRPQAGE
jgi:hypothetical protein